MSSRVGMPPGSGTTFPPRHRERLQDPAAAVAAASSTNGSGSSPASFSLRASDRASGSGSSSRGSSGRINGSGFAASAAQPAAAPGGNEPASAPAAPAPWPTMPATATAAAATAAARAPPRAAPRGPGRPPAAAPDEDGGKAGGEAGGLSAEEIARFYPNSPPPDVHVVNTLGAARAAAAKLMALGEQAGAGGQPLVFACDTEVMDIDVRWVAGSVPGSCAAHAGGNAQLRSAYGGWMLGVCKGALAHAWSGADDVCVCRAVCRRSRAAPVDIEPFVRLPAPVSPPPRPPSRLLLAAPTRPAATAASSASRSTPGLP